MSRRVIAIDLGRGASVLIMVLVHSFWMYASEEAQAGSAFAEFVHIAGRGTAMFLLAMGFSFVLSRRQPPSLAFKRGLTILALGYFMNALKFLVPILLFKTMPESFIAAYGFQSPLTTGQLMYLLRTGDILQLAGISFILLGVICHYAKNRRVLLGLALLVAAISGLLRGYRPHIYGLDYLCDLLWGDRYSVYFPVLPWFSMVLLGAFFGRLYRDHESDERLVFKTMLRFGLLATAVGGALCIYDRAYHFADFFHTGPGGAILQMGIACCLFWLAYQLAPSVNDTWFGATLRYCSSRVTRLYVIQWVVVCWGMGIVGYHEQNVVQVLLLACIVLAVTLAVERLLPRKLMPSSQQDSELHAASTVAASQSH
jgi:uncharacterized membrane protein